MTFGLLGARLLLAVVFVAAGVGKLRDRRGFQKTLVAFGAPAWSAGVAASLIPIVELIVAVLLVAATTAWWGGLASVVLLVAFTGAAAANLAQGRTPNCACFGAAASEPIGPATFARNGVLLAAALLVVGAGPGSSVGATVAQWAAASADVRFLALTALALLTLLVVMDSYASQLRAQSTGFSTRVDTLQQQLRTSSQSVNHEAGGLPDGTPAPPFDLPRLEGDRASLESLTQAGLPVLLIFSSAYCPSCAQLWPDIARWQRTHGGDLTIGVICTGPPHAVEMKLIGTAVANVLLADPVKVAESYQLSLTPSAVMVRPDGRIDGTAVAGVPAIRAMLSQRLGS